MRERAYTRRVRRNTEISFATTSFAGKATFDYKSGDKQLKFTGSEIRVVNTEFAKLATVTIDEGNDAGDSSVTLLVPKLSLLAPGEIAQFETIAIVTAVRRLVSRHRAHGGVQPGARSCPTSGPT